MHKLPHLVCLLAPFASSVARADTTEAHAITLEDIVEDADVACVGTVVDAQVTLRYGPVATAYTIETSESLLGSCEELHTLAIPGGRIGDTIVQAGGVPIWAVGDRVVVFVAPDGRPLLRGLFQLDGDVLLDAFGRRDPWFPLALPALRDALAAR